jgi:TolB-like protein
LTDELIATLGRIGELNVISSTSVTQLKATGRLLPDIAHTLNVDAVLEGTVFVAPRAPDTATGQERVRINARLIYAGSDTQLWNRTFERVFTDILALQSDVATAVAEEINVRLTASQRRLLAGPESQNPEAEQLYIEARGYLTSASRERLTHARTLLERVVTLDPNLARAHAALAVCYIWLESIGGLSRAEAQALSTGAAKRALQLDPNLPEAHAVLGDAELFYDWDWSAAEAAYRRAVEINPSYSWARTRYAYYLSARGRLEESVAEARRAQQADPLSADAAVGVGMTLYWSRRYDEAIEQFRRASELAPSAAQEHIVLARAYSEKRMFDHAIREANEAIRLSGSTPPTYEAELARIYAAAGQRDRARRIIRGLEQRSTLSQPVVPSDALANVYAALGDKDRALDLLERSLQERSNGLLWKGVDPRVDVLRQDPRFAILLQRVAQGSRQ